MVHTFVTNGDIFCYDVEGGTLYEIDDVTRAVIDDMSGRETDLSAYSAEEIGEARQEVAELKKTGRLFCPENKIDISTYSQEIKALCLHISHDCNLRCKYCFADEGKYEGGREVMSFEVAKNAIDCLIKYSGKRHNLEVDFFGGEPLMNFETVKRTVEYAKGEGTKFGKEFKFTLTTNALLLNAEVAEYLNCEMDNVVLSIDGRRQVHDKMRPTINGKGSFDIALKNSLEFRKIRGDKSYYVRGTFTAENIDFQQDVLFLNDCGFDQISIEPVVLDKNSPYALRKEHMSSVNNNYEKLAKEYIVRRKSGDKWFNFFHFFIDMENAPCLSKRLKGCGAGNEYMAVVPGGEIFPCHQFAGKSEYVMGNVFDKQLNLDLKKKFAASNLAAKPICHSCIAKYHCSGGCAANNINFSKDIDKPYELSCDMMRKRLECALYIYSKEKSDI